MATPVAAATARDERILGTLGTEVAFDDGKPVDAKQQLRSVGRVVVDQTSVGDRDRLYESFEGMMMPPSDRCLRDRMAAFPNAIGHAVNVQVSIGGRPDPGAFLQRDKAHPRYCVGVFASLVENHHVGVEYIPRTLLAPAPTAPGNAA